ncbi:hypothetical protein Aperf_G00000038510 [Anoplocephala perfoliata]
MGLGALCLCANLAVMYHFERFRGAASGIAAAGNGLGYIIIPLLLSSLSRYFGADAGWRSAVLVYSIILTLVTFLGSLTFRPIEIETLTNMEVVEIEQMVATSHIGSEKDDAALSDEDFKCISEELKVGIPNGPSPIHNSYPDIPLHFRLHPNYSFSKQCSPVGLSFSTIPMNYSDDTFTTNLSTLPILDRNARDIEIGVKRLPQPVEKQTGLGDDFYSLEESKSTETVQIKSRRLCSQFLEWLVKFFDLTLFMDAGFIIICASSMFFQLAFFVPFTYFLIFATRQAGLVESDALLLITITGFLHTLGRFVGGSMANIPGVDIIAVTAGSCILCAICHFALPFLPHTFVALAVYCSGFGFLCGELLYDRLTTK